jgi:hypothetical protein
MKCCSIRPARLAAAACLLLFAATWPPLAYSAVMQQIIDIPGLGHWTAWASRWVLGAGVLFSLAGARRAGIALAGLGGGLVWAPLLRALEDAAGLAGDPMFEGKTLRELIVLRPGMALPVLGLLVLLLACIACRSGRGACEPHKGMPDGSI